MAPRMAQHAGHAERFAFGNRHPFSQRQISRHCRQMTAVSSGRFADRNCATFLPQRQAQHQDDGQHHLQDRDVPIAPRPALALRERIAHDVGADRCADAPHAVQPAHMPAFVVNGYVVIERRIHSARAKAVWYGDGQQHPVIRGNGEPGQGRRSQRHRNGGDLACPEFQCHSVRKQCRDDREHGNHRGDAAGPRHRHVQILAHGGPRGSE